MQENEVNLIEVFSKRMEQLEKYKDMNPDLIRDFDERSIVIFSQKTYQLNERLYLMCKRKLS